MRYLITARVKPDQATTLLEAIETETLGAGSIAGDEYLHNMAQARLVESGLVRWVEVCFCPSPLAEERPYWEEYFELIKVQDTHDRRHCRDLNGTEPWACCDCDCTERLEAKMVRWGQPFLATLRATLSQ